MEKVTSQTSYQNIKSDGWKALTPHHNLKHSCVSIVALVALSDTKSVIREPLLKSVIKLCKLSRVAMFEIKKRGVHGCG